MPLSAVKVKSILKGGDGQYQDSDGLFLKKRGKAANWYYRYTHLGKRKDMGLGSAKDISLADARQSRDRWKVVLADGRDPISVRNAERSDAKAERDRLDPTFQQMAERSLESRAAKLRAGGKRGRWLSPLEHHMFPVIGSMPMSQIHYTDIEKALKPIWRSKHPTAIKAVRRTKIVFQDAKLLGHKCDPFTVEQAVHALGAVIHVAKPIEATPWKEVPVVWEALGEGSSADCLRWIILTCMRGDAARGARLSEIEGDIWTVPADRMKGNEGKVEPFRVPLSVQAMEIVERSRALDSDLMFPGMRGGVLTSRAIEVYLTKRGIEGRPHGFRTSFRTWAQETQPCTYDIAETILAHKVGNAVERAYARSDLLDLRRPVMQRWADVVTACPARIVQLRA